MSDRNILVVEDDAGIRAVTKFSLEDDGWQVIVACGAKEGLAKAKQLEPNVILCDLVMPNINGFELIKELQSDRTTRNIPVILFTAKSINEELTELQNNDNVLGMITKPFDTLNLTTEILNILNKSASNS